MGIAAAAGIAGIAAAATTVGSTIAGAASGSKGAQQAAGVSAGQTAQTQANIQPYLNLGASSAGTLQSEIQNYGLGQPIDLTSMPMFNWNPTQAGLEQTPGYQFTLQQGLKQQQNMAAARGLGVSGAALKASDAYVTGQANQTYNQQLQNYIATYGQQMNQFQNTFNDYWANQNNRYQILSNTATVGANAAVGGASAQAATTGQVANALTTAGQTTGSGIVGAGTAVSSALQNPYVQNYLTGGGSTITPSQVSSAADVQNAAYMNAPAGTYGPFQTSTTGY